MINIGFISLGCCKNQVDSENIIALFNNTDFKIENNKNNCDVIVINTCGFIESAKKEAIDTILEIAELKKKRLKKLIVCGCFVQRYYDQIVPEFPEVDLFIKIEDYKNLPKILGDLFNLKFDNYGKNRTLISKTYSAYLRISDGCDNRCAYCAIPLIRGNCKSVPIEEVIKEAKRLKEIGIKELNIIAQDTTYYGYDLYTEFRLKDILKEVDKLGFKWVRILYMYPDEIQDELLYTIKECKSVIPYFDIPIQYGNDKILELMNRRGTTSHILNRINKIREIFGDKAIIRTTLIVGFPYETEDTFKDTLKLIDEIKFDSLGAFTYSKEEDTKAYDYPEVVDSDTANRRLDELMSLQKEIINTKNKNHIGESYEVLIEGYDSINKMYYGRSIMSAPDDVDGRFFVRNSEELREGEFYNCKVIDYSGYDLIGELDGNL